MPGKVYSERLSISIKYHVILRNKLTLSLNHSFIYSTISKTHSRPVTGTFWIYSIFIHSYILFEHLSHCSRLLCCFLFFLLFKNIEVGLIYSLSLFSGIQHSSSTVTHIIKSSPPLVQLLPVNIQRCYRIIGHILHAILPSP